MALMAKQGRSKKEYRIDINFNYAYKAVGVSMKSGSWVPYAEVANILEI
ncbi:hypothetical protein SAMN04488689_102426 [Paenibacillus sp. cl6col]|nr:hypothetical protein [Paenibacillus sp. cl6col]SDE74491.1 hypothetical protein SAMN04488689_102426 [Paenibacillus sp. cl6col]